MKIPNHQAAHIAPAKLKDYLLSESHPIGRWKAKFFRGFGFDETNMDVLEQGLKAIAQTEDVKETEASPHGIKYVIQGKLATPVGRVVQVDTVWIIEKGQEHPKFVTAFPA